MKGRGGGSAGLLCRSHSATAVCLPQDPQLMVVPRWRPGASAVADLTYSRLGGGDPGRRRSSGAGRRPVTLSMLTAKKAQIGAPPLPINPAGAAAEGRLVFQVVVMRVSLHCKGCEGKVRKHISKMEGVTSFSIDLETKRVTVMGHVSPLGVLESISKVKKAELIWP